MDLIPALKHIPGLSYLALNWNDLENNSQQGLTHLSSFVHDDSCELVYLDLRNSNLGSESSKNLDLIVSSNRLKHIDLSWNNIGDIAGQAVLRGLMQRTSSCQLELKGCGIGEALITQIRQQLTHLSTRYQDQTITVGATDASLQGLGPDDVIGMKRMELSKIYNPNLTNHLTEIRSKTVSDGSRIILNPHTAELEILMGEMIKKKIMAKDRVLRELESYIAENREADNELELLKTNYLQLGNESNALSLELEQLKATYIRTKEHKKIE